MKKFVKRNAGIFLGAIYALTLRLIFNVSWFNDIFSLFSITFLWIIPTIIGLIPLLYAPKEQLKRLSYRISSPVLTVIVFFTLRFVTGVEDLICLWVILIPYMVGAMTAGLIAGEIIERIKDKKGITYSIILFPFIASLIEQRFETPVNSYSVITKIEVNASPEKIWENIVRVDRINEKEYPTGFFNYAGVPRPLYAELNNDTLGATRVGHFEGGLKFIEKVTSWDRNRQISFDISVEPSSIRQTVFDQHILKGKYFRFLNARYVLKSLPNGQTELTLSSSYILNTKINAYASFCGNQLLNDFQNRLLKVIKTRCEK